MKSEPYLLVLYLVEGKENVLPHAAIEPCLVLVVLAELPEEVLDLSEVAVIGLKHGLKRGEGTFVVHGPLLHVGDDGFRLLLRQLGLGLGGRWLGHRGLYRGHLARQAHLQR